MPDYEFSSQHSVHVNASPERTRAVLDELKPRDLLLTRTLMGLRSIPGRLRGRPNPLRESGPMNQGLPGAVELVNRESEIALGLVGQFWKPVARPIPLSGPEEFTN